MTERKPQRIARTLSPAEQERLATHRAAIAAELPDLVARDQLRKEAREEATLSGELRRAIHMGEESLSKIAAQANMDPLHLDEFLTGERTLRSDVLDRLARAIGVHLKVSSATTN